MSFWQRILRAAPYHAHFLGSFNHAWLALCTVGLGVAVATPLSLAVGVATYGLGVIFLPDLPAFRRGFDKKRTAEVEQRQAAEAQERERVRQSLLGRLTPKAGHRYQAFARQCEELNTRLARSATDDFIDASAITKVSDSYLLLLAMDVEVREYLGNAEKSSDLKTRAREMEGELTALRERRDLSDVEQRLLLSKEETFKTLQQQADQSKKMQQNLDLAQSEMARLESQVAFLSAELISTPASQLSQRLGDTLIQVQASQRVLQEGGMVTAPDLNTLLGEHA